jgi:exonuclease SbcC
VPRVGDDVKQLISQGAERLHVSLEFSSDGGRYRIHRSTGHKGLPTVQLERFEAGDWAREADRVRDANQQVARILGMDYDGFVRSVLLPQGQFQQFLSGKPEQRRKVLDGLLRLDIYERMQKSANEMAREHTTRAESLQHALDQYGGATPEALDAARSLLDELTKHAQTLEAQRDAISAAARTAEALTAAIARKRQAESAAGDAAGRLERAKKLLESGEASVAKLKAELAGVQKQIAANSYDADLLIRLSQALDLIQRVEKAEKRLVEMRKQADRAGPHLARLLKDADTGAAAAEEAALAVADAEAHLEAARRDDLAAGVRHGLKPGDPCPVCGQKIAALPKGAPKAFAAAEAALKKARAAELAARERAQTLATQVAVAERDGESLAGQITELDSDTKADHDSLAKLLPGEKAIASEVAASVRAQTEARRDRESLEAKARDSQAEIDELTAEMAEAKNELTQLDTEIKLNQKAAGEAEDEIAAARTSLTTAAEEHRWDDIAAKVEAGGDPSPVLRARLDAAESQLAAAHKQIGGAEAEIKRIEEGIAKAKEIAGEVEAARTAATLAKDLASLLGVRAFPNYIRERALRMLARNGSAQLFDISDKRYEFRVEGQEFMVVDSWNMGEARSVKTLSGGETFLASLALALALAETLPILGAGTHAGTLESLLIDEGFSNLDVATLDDVVNALEIIGKDRTRMVGIVTHLEELAERMPSRIRVHKDRSHSTITIE